MKSFSGGLLAALAACGASAADYVIDVPAGESQTLDATAVTAEITNIRKTGAGDLIATPLPDYEGDFTIEGGRFILNQNGDLGKDNVGTCYVNDGGTLCYCKNDMIARGETIVFAGQPAAGYTYKLGRTKIPSDYKETWKYFSDAASKYRATDADVVFASEGNRFQMLGTYDANGHDLLFDQRYATTTWANIQFNCGLKITNARDVIIGYAKANGSTDDAKSRAELMSESGQMKLYSKNGGSRLIVVGNATVNRACMNFSRPITTDGNWTLVFSNAELRVNQPSTNTVIQHTWNGGLALQGPYAKLVLNARVASLQVAGTVMFGAGTSLAIANGDLAYPTDVVSAASIAGLPKVETAVVAGGLKAAVHTDGDLSYLRLRKAVRGFYVSLRSSVQEVLEKYLTCSFLDATGASLRTQAGIARNGYGVAPYVGSAAEELVGWRIGGTTYTPAEFAALPLAANTEAQAVVTPKAFTVKFLDSDGASVLKSMQVDYGADAVPPTPTKSGYTFVKWDRAYTNITDDLSVKAVWRSAAKPSSYQDVTTYSYDGFFGIGKFSPLVANDASKAADNASSLSAMISKVGNGGVLYFPKGTYYVSSRIDIASAGVTLWGEAGAEIVRTGVTNVNSTPYADNATSGSDYNWATIMVVAANNVTIRGLAFRYAVPTCFTAEILTVKSDGSQTARLVDGRDADFNKDLRFQRINNFDASGRPLGLDLIYGSGTTAGTHYKQASQISTGSDGRKTFTLWLGANKVNVGDRVTLCCSTAYSQGIILYGATSTISDLVFEDVTVSNCFSMTMVVKNVKNLTLRRFRVEDDTPGALYATGMDGIHVAGLGGKLTMEDCELRGLADDMLNVHATAGVVGSVSGTTVTLASSVESGSFNKGETVKFYTAKLADLGTAKISSASTTSLTVDALPDGVTTNCLIGNETKMPEVSLSGCRFGVTRARGILLQTDAKIEVKNCEFHNTRLAGMLLSPSATGQWTEMGPIRDALITNCTFTACGVAEASTANKNNGAIVIRCNHDQDYGWAFDKAANRNIRVLGNRFADSPSVGVFASNTTGLQVNGNTFVRCGGRVASCDDRIVRLEYCVNVGITNNVTYASDFKGSNIADGNCSGVTYANNSIWYDISFVDADGTLLAKVPVLCWGKLTKPAWSDNLTTATGVFSAWQKSDGTAYDFSANVPGPFELKAAYAPRP